MKTLVKMNFNPEIAKDVGTDAAIIFENIVYWIHKNMTQQMGKDKQPSYKEGGWWTYNSRKAFGIQFTWLTDGQIRVCLDKLEAQGYIKTGNFNKIAYDRTKWYSLGENDYATRLIGEMNKSIGEMNKSIGSERQSIGDSNQPIPNDNTNKNRGGRKTPPPPASQVGSLRSHSTKSENTTGVGTTPKSVGEFEPNGIIDLSKLHLTSFIHQFQADLLKIALQITSPIFTPALVVRAKKASFDKSDKAVLEKIYQFLVEDIYSGKLESNLYIKFDGQAVNKLPKNFESAVTEMLKVVGRFYKQKPEILKENLK